MAVFWKALTDRELESVNKWLLEYACFSSYHDFITSGTVDEPTRRNFVQGILYRIEGRLANRESVNYVHLLRLLCLLADGQEPQNEYEDEDDEEQMTVLERALAEYVALTSNQTDQEENLFSQDVADYEDKIKEQAVYVCCRTGKFQDAKAVYERTWKPVEKSSKETWETCKKLKSLIQRQNKDDKILQENPFEEFLEHGISVLPEIIGQRFREPFLVTASRRVCAKLKSPEATRSERIKRKAASSSSPKARIVPKSIVQSNSEQKISEVEVINENQQSNKEQDVHKKGSELDEDTKKENSDIHLNGDMQKRLDEDMNRVANERMLHRLAVDLGVSYSVKKLQLNKDKQTALFEKLDKFRKDKEKSRVKLCKRMVELSDNGTETENRTTAIRKRLAPQQKIGPQPNKKRHIDTENSETAADNSEDRLTAVARQEKGTDNERSTRENDTSIRNHKLRRNVSRPDRHRMPDLDSPSDSDGVSDISDLAPFPKLNETVIDTACGGSVKKRKRPFRIKWTEKEERLFFQGVMELGQGNWAEIKAWGKFPHRTSVNLKDKWRTLLNMSGRLKELEKWYRTTGGISTPERNQIHSDDD